MSRSPGSPFCSNIDVIYHSYLNVEENPILKSQNYIYVVIILLVFFICPLAYADELSDLKEKVKTLEGENQILKNRLEAYKIPIEERKQANDIPSKAQPIPKNAEQKQEKSLATLAGLNPPKEPFIKSGFIDLNYYYDDRKFNVMTINLLANLPADIQYFSLTDLTAPADSQGSGVFDLSNFYMEHHFRRPIAKDNEWLKPLDWTVQYVDGSSAKDLIRLGTRVRTQDIQGPIGEFVKKLGLWFNVDFHWYESDGEGMEIEPVYGGSYFDGFLIVEGFADIDFAQKNETDDKIVMEHQIGFRIIDNLYYVTEFKYNGFRGDADRWSTAFGLKYTVPFWK